MSQMREFLSSGLAVMKSGFSLTSGERLEARLAACRACPDSQIDQNGMSCGICGCDVLVKARFEAMNCPVTDELAPGNVSRWGENIDP